MEGGVEDSHIRCFGNEFRAGFYSLEIGWIVEWSEVVEFFEVVEDFFCDFSGGVIFLAAVNDAMTDGIDIVDMFEDAGFFESLKRDFERFGVIFGEDFFLDVSS